MDKIKIDTSIVETAHEDVIAISAAIDNMKFMTKSISETVRKAMETYSVMADSMSGIKETVEIIQNSMKAYASIDMSYLKTGLLSDSFLTSMKELQDSLKMYDQSYMYEAIGQMKETLNSFDNSMIEQLRSINYAAIISDIAHTSSISEMVSVLFTAMPEDVLENSFQKEFTEPELQEAVQEQISEPEKFQKRFAGWPEELKKRYSLFCVMLQIIVEIFIMPYMQENVGLPVTTFVVSQVKELPQKGADVICKIKKGVDAIIVENTNYYYKIWFIDENGEEKEGYVAKRNLKIIEDGDEEESESENEQND